MTVPQPDLASYDVILVSTSGGKDSQVMLSVVTKCAEQAGVRDRVVAVHADLGWLEWSGCPELAAEQAAIHEVPFHVVKRPQGDILDMVRAKHARNVAKGKPRPPWPGYQIRDCTKQHKTQQVWRLMTRLAREVRDRAGRRPARILDCWGNRAEESRRRAKQSPFEYNREASNKKPAEWARVNGVRYVDTWLPIHAWTEGEVWGYIEAERVVPHHWAYDVGMPRLSCVFCFYAVLSKKNQPLPAEQQTLWLVAGYHNRPLLREYVKVEQETGYTYVQGFSMADLEQVLEQGWQPPPFKGRYYTAWRD